MAHPDKLLVRAATLLASLGFTTLIKAEQVMGKEKHQRVSRISKVSLVSRSIARTLSIPCHPQIIPCHCCRFAFLFKNLKHNSTIMLY